MSREEKPRRKSGNSKAKRAAQTADASEKKPRGRRISRADASKKSSVQAGGRSRNGTKSQINKEEKGATKRSRSRASTARKPPKQTRPGRRIQSKKHKSKKGKKSPSVLLRLFLALLFGATTGVLFCGYCTFLSAQKDVENWLAPNSHSQSTEYGSIWSSEMKLWVGAPISKDMLSDYLLASGYNLVDRIEQSQDFVEKNTSLVINNIGANRPQTAVKATIFFSEGKILSIEDENARERPYIILNPVNLANFYRRNNSAKINVALDTIPSHVPEAILAMEDSRFYEHEGVDFIGLTRAVVVNLIINSKAQGASTITQQLVKNLILNNPEKTYKRKAREALRALALEQQLSKQELLELYLNEVYLGQVNGRAVVGVGQAAKIYFGKPIERLSVGEAAMLSGIISAPNAYSPLRHPEKARTRRDIALKRMLDLGKIDMETYEKSKEADLALNIVPERRRADWFVDAVVENVESQLGPGVIADKSLRVQTTLHPLLQHALELATKQTLEELGAKRAALKDAQVAAVAIEAKTGNILALVGGRDYRESQFNRAIYAKRQVGSTAKPLLYGILFDTYRELSPGCWIEDKELVITKDGKDWKPQNYDHKYREYLTLREALRVSRNVPTVNIYQLLQEEKNNPGFFADFGKKIGLYDISKAPSNALGAFDASPIEMASAYSIFANQGKFIDYNLIEFAKNQKGERIYAPVRQTPKKVLSAESAWMVQSMLETVVKEGTAKSAKRYGAKGALAGKTGTTNDNHDAWFVGYDSEIIVAVWVGFDKGKALGLTGSQAALPVWSRFMATSRAKREGDFAQQDGLVRLEVCADFPDCERKEEDWFVQNKDTSEMCTLFAHEENDMFDLHFPFGAQEVGDNIKERLRPKGQAGTEKQKNKEEKEEGLLFRLFPFKKEKK